MSFILFSFKFTIKYTNEFDLIITHYKQTFGSIFELAREQPLMLTSVILLTWHHWHVSLVKGRVKACSRAKANSKESRDTS